MHLQLCVHGRQGTFDLRRGRSAQAVSRPLVGVQRDHVLGADIHQRAAATGRGSGQESQGSRLLGPPRGHSETASTDAHGRSTNQSQSGRGRPLLTLRRPRPLPRLCAVPDLSPGRHLAHFGGATLAELLEGLERLCAVPLLLSVLQLLCTLPHPTGLQDSLGATPGLLDPLPVLLLLHALCTPAGSSLSGCSHPLLPLQAQVGAVPDP
mmetsp:Transcript_49727/g.79195  ORF Transcript_49727/g.79195 Transcript_49727/m.79195 type:complete len:209 (-) Transcript_49727:83-709(-)